MGKSGRNAALPGTDISFQLLRNKQMESDIYHVFNIDVVFYRGIVGWITEGTVEKGRLLLFSMVRCNLDGGAGGILENI